MSKHTPGPWQAKYLSGAGWQIHADIKSHLGERYSNEYPICQNEAIVAYDPWRQWPKKEFDDMQEANIKLMAAAPDLLAALETMLQVYEANLPDHCNAEWYEDYNQAVAALNKAKGIPS